MVLKEAFTYQNYLTELISQIENYLVRPDFTQAKKQVCHRSKVDRTMEDETVIVRSSVDVEFAPMDLVNLMTDLLNEKQSLSDAITDAKRKTEIDIDSSVSMNRIKQEYITVLEELAKRKDSTSDTQGIGYRFNEAGDQVKYFFPMEEIVTINYDRKDIKGIIRKLKKETDKISLMLDKLQLTTEVSFEPKYQLGDTLEDIVVSN